MISLPAPSVTDGKDYSHLTVAAPAAVPSMVLPLSRAWGLVRGAGTMCHRQLYRVPAGPPPNSWHPLMHASTPLGQLWPRLCRKTSSHVATTSPPQMACLKSIQNAPHFQDCKKLRKTPAFFTSTASTLTFCLLLTRKTTIITKHGLPPQFKEGLSTPASHQTSLGT